MTTVDGQSTYTKSDLIDLLAQLMKFYRPDEIDTQTPLSASATVQDHSDHITTGQLAAAAQAQYAQAAPIKYYTGYPIGLLPQNVSGQDLTDTTAAFHAYVPHDMQVCLNPADCAPSGPYATWLMREYVYTPGDPLIASPAAPAAQTTPEPTTPDPTTQSPTSPTSPTPNS
jgi:hypothetical protein